MTTLEPRLRALAEDLRSPDPDVRDTGAYPALLIAIVTDRDNRTARASDEAVGRWLRAVAGWYVDEPDTRGWDDDLGWLHAVAHGADATGELAVSPRLGRDELATLLDLLVGRTVAPTGTCAPALHTPGCALAEIPWFYGSPA